MWCPGRGCATPSAGTTSLRGYRWPGSKVNHRYLRCLGGDRRSYWRHLYRNFRHYWRRLYYRCRYSYPQPKIAEYCAHRVVIVWSPARYMTPVDYNYNYGHRYKIIDRIKIIYFIYILGLDSRFVNFSMYSFEYSTLLYFFFSYYTL